MICEKSFSQFGFTFPKPAFFYEQNFGVKFQNNNGLVTPYSRRYGIALGNLFGGFGLDESYIKTQEYNFKYIKRSIYPSAFGGYNYCVKKKFWLSGIIGFGYINNNDTRIETNYGNNNSFAPDLSGLQPDINLDLRIMYEVNDNSKLLVGFQHLQNTHSGGNYNSIYVGLNYNTSKVFKLLNNADTIKNKTINKSNKKYSLFIGTSTQKFGGYIDYFFDEKDIYNNETYFQLAAFTRVSPSLINLLSFGSISKKHNILYISVAKRDYFDIDNSEYNPTLLNSSFIYKSNDVYTRLNYTLNAFSFFDKLSHWAFYPIIDFSIFNVRKDMMINRQYGKQINGNNVGENTIDMKVKSSLYLFQVGTGFGFRLKHLYGNFNLGLINRNYINATVNRTINVYPKSINGSSIVNKTGEYNLPEIQIKGSTESAKFKDEKYFSVTGGFVF